MSITGRNEGKWKQGLCVFDYQFVSPDVQSLFTKDLVKKTIKRF